MKLKSTEKVNKMIESVLSEKEAETADLSRKLDDTRRDKAAANGKLSDATLRTDIKEYRKAKADLGELEDLEEMYSRRFNSLNEEPLISREEYEAAVQSIKDEVNKLMRKMEKKLYDLTMEMLSVANEAREVTAEADGVLGKLQHKVYKDQDRTIGSFSGAYSAYTRQHVDTQDVISWAEAYCQIKQYKQYAQSLHEDEQPILENPEENPEDDPEAES